MKDMEEWVLMGGSVSVHRWEFWDDPSVRMLDHLRVIINRM